MNLIPVEPPRAPGRELQAEIMRPVHMFGPFPSDGEFAMSKLTSTRDSLVLAC